MNRQEAISQLKYCTFDKIEQINKYDKEALDMAIEALKTDPINVEDIQSLPSVQPKSIECKDVICLSKGAVKKRTGRYVVYDVDWLKKNFATEAKIYGQSYEPINPQNGITNNEINLCDSCMYDYPECPCSKDDVLFGEGKGHDNICCCNNYITCNK